MLQLAEEPGIPLLERAKFCAIISTNLDEFFQVRVAALKDQIVAGIDDVTIDGRTPPQQLTEIGRRDRRLIERLETSFLDRLCAGSCAERGITSCRGTNRHDRSRAGHASTFFEERVFPVLTPLAVDPGHPFPYISDLALSSPHTSPTPNRAIAASCGSRFPTVFPRLLPLGTGRFLPVEAAHRRSPPHACSSA